MIQQFVNEFMASHTKRYQVLFVAIAMISVDVMNVNASFRVFLSTQRARAIVFVPNFYGCITIALTTIAFAQVRKVSLFTKSCALVFPLIDSSQSILFLVIDAIRRGAWRNWLFALHTDAISLLLNTSLFGKSSAVFTTSGTGKKCGVFKRFSTPNALAFGSSANLLNSVFVYA